MRSGIFFLAFLAASCGEAPPERPPDPEPLRLTVDDDGRVSYRGAVRTDLEIDTILDRSRRLLDLQHPARPGCFGPPEVSHGMHVDVALPRSVPRARQGELLAMIDAHQPQQVTLHFTGRESTREKPRIELRLDDEGAVHYRGRRCPDTRIGTVVDKAGRLYHIRPSTLPGPPSQLSVHVIAPMSVPADRIREVCEIISWQHPKEIRVTLRRADEK